ncbi:MAG: HD domain-containing protein [Bacteroidales bacterium]|nr:HD domain-containing protein [Bacteroidales bacterium]MCF8390171.1 HD domain-containing protein [Bacteroidales bacterium]
MTSLSENINLAENIWLKKSFLYLKEAFSNAPLPSHDHYHHLRVWLNAKFLLQQMQKIGVSMDYDFTEALLIASMFHDSGMITTQGHDHGLAGRNICTKFLAGNEKKPANPEEILNSIEKHDNKNYNGPGPMIVDRKPNLLTALNISDDMDAMATIGIYRYTEIYLMRAIPFEDLGLKIMANLSGRYNNFLSNCSNMPEVIWMHKPRYNQIQEFFDQYNRQIQRVESGRGNENTGPLAVVKTIHQQALRRKGDMYQICDSIISQNPDMYIQKFFIQLRTELKNQHINI